MIADNLQRRLHKLANANVKEMWNTIKPINMCRVARTHSWYWKLIKFNMRLRHFGHIQ